MLDILPLGVHGGGAYRKKSPFLHPRKSNVDPLTKMCFGCGFARGFQFVEQQVVQQIHNKQQIEVNEFDV